MWILIILVLVTLRAGNAHADAVKWRLMRTKHFTIYYPERHKVVAARAGKIAEGWHAILSRKLKFAPKAIVPIYLYPDRKSFSKAIGDAPSDTVVGMAQVHLLDIRVDASGAFADIARIIPHELVHIFVSAYLGANYFRLPVWMHEGLAKYYGKDWSGTDVELLADAASGNGLIPFKELALSFPAESKKRDIAYVESYSAVSYMAKTYTESSIPDLLYQIKDGQLFPTAMRYSIGVSPERFESDWRQHLLGEYNSNRWIRFATAFIWFGTSVVVVLAFRARLIQKRRKAREFEEEEEAES